MAFETSPLDAARAALDIPAIGRLLFPSWRCGASCRAPWREDRHASLSVYANGARWKDHATGEGGDAVDFVARSLGCSLSDAALELIRMAGTGGAFAAPPRVAPPPPVVPRLPERVGKPCLDGITVPTVGHLAAIASLRGWATFAPLEIAVRRGLLWAQNASEEGPAWVLTDDARRAAQARRLDGKPWAGIDAKAKTLRGSSASWPVGAANIGERPLVLVAEGGPDMLAALTVAWLLDAADIAAPVAMLGAGQRIHPDALPHFAGRHVRVVEQADAAGARAGRKWFDQLRAVARHVDGWEPPPGEKDLADVLARLSRENETPEDLAAAARGLGVLDALHLET